MCIRSVTYSIVHGGFETEKFTPSRGLRQGCPLSPYLFILCAKGFSALLRRYKRRGLLHGCKIAQSALVISHLLFADDSFLFFRANMRECDIIRACINDYERASGQQINFQKSSISFSVNTPLPLQDLICSSLNVLQTTGHGKYLGLPSFVGRNKTQVLSFLKEKFWSRLASWKKRFLSKAGKEVLIKTVAQALPTYAMSVFLLPLNLCADLERIMSRFWWRSNSGESSGIHWKSWNALCARKRFGGLGFRKLHDFNLAMLGKNGWRLLTSPNSLVARVYKAKYYRRTDFLHANKKNNASFIWSSILAAQDLIKQNVRWRVGDGSSINIWADAWLPDDANPRISSPPIPGLLCASVQSLMTPNEQCWDIDLIHDLFIPRDRALILQVPLPALRSCDNIFWCKDTSGMYSVRSAYRTLTAHLNFINPAHSSQIWKKLWLLKIPPKVRNLIWRICNGCLPTKENLRQRRVDVDSSCSVCAQSMETTSHLFLHCPIAVECWRRSALLLPSLNGANIIQWIEALFMGNNIEAIQLSCVLLWSLWKNRNDAVWKNLRKWPSTIVNLAGSFLAQWQHAQILINGDLLSDPNSGVVSWCKPACGWLKCNVDGAVFSSESKLGFGMVLRNSEGTMIAARCGSISGPADSVLAEAVSFREALSWLKSLGASQVIVESDSSMLIQAIQASSSSPNYVGLVVNECKDLVASIVDCRIYFVRRSANSVAHLLARASNSMSDVQEWGSIPPPFICNALSFDLQL